MKLLGLSGSVTPRSKTLIAVETAVDFGGDVSPLVETETINLNEYDNIQFCDGRDPAAYTGNARIIIDKIIEADALIIGTPIYRGSYTGALKNIFDLIPNDALRGKSVGLVATGGTYHHFLSIEHQLKPLVGYFQAHIVPGAVYAHNDHYSNKTLIDKKIIERLKALGESTVQLHELLGGGHVGAEKPAMPRKTLEAR